MELVIYSPKPEERIPEVQWNFEEIKLFAAEKAKEYQSIAYTISDVRDMKKDRADVNRFINALEDARKNKKKEYMAPYEVFERQVKEALRPLKETVDLIDQKLGEVEQVRREEKRREIEELFAAIGFQPFVKLEQIWDEKWLNATVTIKKIEEQMKSKMYQIGEDVFAIQSLPEFSFEAMEVYKKTLDVTGAIQEGMRLVDIQRRKSEHEEDQRRRQEEAVKAERETEAQEPRVTKQPAPGRAAQPETQAEPQKRHEETIQQEDKPQIYKMDFRVWGTKEQIMGLKQYLVDNNIKFGKVE